MHPVDWSQPDPSLNITTNPGPEIWLTWLAAPLARHKWHSGWWVREARKIPIFKALLLLAELLVVYMWWWDMRKDSMVVDPSLFDQLLVAPIWWWDKEGLNVGVLYCCWLEGPTVGSFTNVGSTVGGKCVVESWRDDYSTIVLGTHCWWLFCFRLYCWRQVWCGEWDPKLVSLLLVAYVWWWDRDMMKDPLLVALLLLAVLLVTTVWWWVG